jgi:hypothetical protein
LGVGDAPQPCGRLLAGAPSGGCSSVTLDQLIAHFQENWQIYAGVFICALPIIYLTRRISVQIILWSAEVAIYGAILHIVVAGIVRMANWFKTESQMAWREEERVDPGWSTPLIEFWRTELYSPGWVFYFEVVAVIFFFYMVSRLRPVRPQKPKLAPPPKRPGQRGYRPPQYKGPGSR